MTFVHFCVVKQLSLSPNSCVDEQHGRRRKKIERGEEELGAGENVSQGPTDRPTGRPDDRVCELRPRVFFH